MRSLTRDQRKRVEVYGAPGFRRWQEGRRELLRELVASGWTTVEIAQVLEMSPQRVRVLLAGVERPETRS